MSEYIELLERVATAAEDVVEEKTTCDDADVTRYVPAEDLEGLTTAVDDLQRFRAAAGVTDGRRYIVIDGVRREVREIDREARWGLVGSIAVLFALTLAALAVLK